MPFHSHASLSPYILVQFQLIHSRWLHSKPSAYIQSQGHAHADRARREHPMLQGLDVNAASAWLLASQELASIKSL